MASKELLKLSPDESDILNNYSWTTHDNKLARAEAPRITIKEFQQSTSALQEAVKYWANQAAVVANTSKTGDPYAALYSVSSEIGNSYTFPFYSTSHHNVENAWGENRGAMQVVQSAINAVSTLGNMAFPSVGIEQAKSWTGTKIIPYQFMFTLLNTVHPGDIKKNQTFIRAFLNNNLGDKADFLVTKPPVLCLVEIPGIRGRNVAVLSNIIIENIGQLNYIETGGEGANVPDAYQITVTVQELITESRQILDNQISETVFATVDNAITDLNGVSDLASRVPTIPA